MQAISLLLTLVLGMLFLLVSTKGSVLAPFWSNKKNWNQPIRFVGKKFLGMTLELRFRGTFRKL